MLRALTAALLLTLPQTPTPATPPPAFVATNVHPSPFVRTRFTNNFNISGDRFVSHQSTLLNLIAFAYDLDPTLVQGGPPWIGYTRFEVAARLPPKFSFATDIRPMLQTLLADRFHLVVHKGTASLPAYILTVDPTSKAKLKPSDPPPADEPPRNNCSFRMIPYPPEPGVTPALVGTCTNMPAANIAQLLHNMASDYLNKPVIDQTGLTGRYDIEIKWSRKDALAQTGSNGTSIFDAADKQLGLKLELKTSPIPVLFVDSALETPTPNAPDLAKLMPPLPPPQFDVATIKPYKSTDPLKSGAGLTGDGSPTWVSLRFTRTQVDIRGAPVRYLILYAYGLEEFEDPEVLVNLPKWADTDRWDIMGKAAVDPTADPKMPFFISQDDLRLMLRALLADRFKLQTHTDTQPYTGYTLTAPDPRIKPSDPTARTRCGDEVFPVAKDPRVGTARNLLVQCQNISMAQFVKELSTMSGFYMHRPPIDATGLKGGYDLQLNFSSAFRLPDWQGPPNPTIKDNPDEPNSAISLYDAVRTQLGLKLVKDKHPGPVLVIDHIEETPTDN
jgi:uncharacterized protein (TIGR03435 family)